MNATNQSTRMLQLNYSTKGEKDKLVLSKIVVLISFDYVCMKTNGFEKEKYLNNTEANTKWSAMHCKNYILQFPYKR